MDRYVWKLFWIIVPLGGLLLGSGCAGPATGPTAQTEVAVAAAADLKFVFPEVVAAFERANPSTQVKTTYGSSGVIFSQLQNKAPFDIFLSADTDFPTKLVGQGLADPVDQFVYAVGSLVVWVPAGSKLDLDKSGMGVLNEPSVKKLALANPKFAPYGRAAEAALKKLGIYDRVRDRLVLGDNIAQAAQFVETGAADVGLLAHSLATAPTMRDKGRYCDVPRDAYPPLVQGGVVLSRARDRDAANRLRDFLTGEPGRAILTQFGFDLPGG